MRRLLCMFYLVASGAVVMAQTSTEDTVQLPKVVVVKDARIDMLAKLQTDINNYANRFTKGYRLFVLKSNNRDYAMKVRSYLLQNFPDEKVIMTYQSPFIKMKFGDFEDKKEAERIRDIITRAGVITGNVYVIPDTIELKPDRIGKTDF